MAIIQKTDKLSKLPELEKILSGMQTVLVYNKQNYAIDLEQIKGKKVTDIIEVVSDKSGGRNVIILKFDDGTTQSLYVYNGTQGEQGKTGDDGDKGDKGDAGEISSLRAQELTIVNDNKTDDPHKAWSALKGKEANDAVQARYETFVSDAEYERLLINIAWIKAEFVSDIDNEDVTIFNNDTNEHYNYVKYWTWEDSEAQTYYIGIYDNENNIVRYDPVVARLWEDIYLGAKSGYFEATNAQLTAENTPLYFYNEKNNDYQQIESILEAVTVDGVNEVRYLGNKRFDYYDKKLGTYVHAQYMSRKWSYELIAKPLDIIVYEFDGAHFTAVMNDDIDLSGITPYYAEANEETLISEINAYVQRNNVRFYVYDENTSVSHTHPAETGIEVTGHYKEVAPDTDSEGNDILDRIPSAIDLNNYQEYIIETYDRVSDTRTFDHFYSKTVYGETFYVNETSVYKGQAVTLYVNMDKRNYFTSSIDPVKDADGNITGYETNYTQILIPFWIHAKFETIDEDENILILNSNKELGDEDNTEIDTTVEDDDTDQSEKIHIKHIICGSKPNIYKKNSQNEYVVVNLNNEFINTENNRYFVKEAEPRYREVTFDEASRLIDSVYLYTQNNEGEWIYEGDTLDSEKTYAVAEDVYTDVTDIVRIMLYETSIELENGVPYQLPITLYPDTTNVTDMIMQFDPTKVTLFEDGRIAAITDNCETDIILSSVNNPNITSTIHVTLTTPMKTVSIVTPDSTNINVGNNIILETAFTPANTSVQEIEFTSSDTEIATVEALEDNKVKVTAVKPGNVTITATAADGYGAHASIDLTMIENVSELNWNLEGIETPITDLTKSTTPDNVVEIDGTYYFKDTVDYDPNTGEYETNENSVSVRYMATLLMGTVYDLPVDVVGEHGYEATNQNITWTINRTYYEIKQETRTITDVPAVYRPVTDDDVVEDGVEEILVTPAVEHDIKVYTIKGLKATDDYLHIIGTNTYNGANATIDLYIRIDQAIEEITVSPNAISFNINTKKQLKATVAPDTAVNGTFIWSVPSQYSNIVRVDENGTITAIGAGNAVVQAVAQDGSGVIGTCDVTITYPAKSIEIGSNNVNGIVYVGIGKTTQLETVMEYNGATEIGEFTLGANWSSADESIATVNENGVVTGVSTGVTTIIAAAKDNSGIFGSVRVSVIKLATALTFNEETIAMNINDSYVLAPIFTPEDTSNEVVLWEIADETIATVKDGGIITALAAGTTTIKATTTDGSSLEATCTITVS